MTITIETRGRRHYLLGNTYPIKDAVKAAGCRWDADARAWYSGKRETVESLVRGVVAGEIEAKAAYRKLANGSWGVLVPGKAEPGQRVTVVTKAGAEKTETVLAIIEATEQGSLCSVQPRARRSSGGYRSRPRGRWTGCSCGSIEDHPRESDCAQCQHDY